MKISASLLGLATALLFSVSAPAPAAINATDDVPAATLLLPYFDVDPANPAGTRTVMTVGNRSATETLAHVTLWSDRGVPTYRFDVRLAGHGVSEIDLSALFGSGTLPQSSAGGFATCAGVLPPAPLDAATLTGLRNAHSGQASSLLGGQCASTPQGDGHARGYATVDVVNACTTLVPGDAGYFVLGGNGIARNDNVLWGEQSSFNAAQGLAHGDALVHIEASATNPATNGAGDYTFYGRRLGGTGADNREILGGNWIGRFSLQDTLFKTTAMIWRDPGNVAAFACGSPPGDISQRQVLVFDHQEQPAMVNNAMRLPLATQAVDLSNPSLSGIPFAQGFVRYNLQLSSATAPFDVANQSHVSHVTRSIYGDSGQATVWAEERSFIFDIPVPIQECNDGIDNDGDGLIDFPADPSCVSAAQGVENTACSNGNDDDSDTFIDFPADPQCGAAYDQTEDLVRICQDGIDNDGDGLIDWPVDPGCSSPNDATEFRGQCDDGIDNDGDGLIDFPADPGCTSVTDNTEANPQCSDGLDNDSDGQIDFPADTSCPNADANTEVTQCSDGLDNDGDTFIDLVDPTCGGVPSNNAESTQCSDGIDNDADTFIDFPADIGCSSLQDTNETNSPQCSDGRDNDGNGIIDYPNEPGCTTPTDVFEGPDCSDTIDNDMDGAVDAPDPGCAGPTDYNELANALSRSCSDGIDNDGDGAIDFPADAGCASAWDDVEYSPTGGGIVIVVNPATLPNGITGTFYAAALSATGGLTPYTFAVSAGSLPPGLTLAADGTLAGNPTTVGTFAFTVTATDLNGFTGTRSYSVTVGAPPVLRVPVPALSIWSLLALLALISAVAWAGLRR